MRISVVTPQVFAVTREMPYGAEWACVLIADALAKKGHNVTMYAPKGSRCQDAAVVETVEPSGEWGAGERRAFDMYKDCQHEVILDFTHHYYPCVLANKVKVVHTCFGIQTAIPNLDSRVRVVTLSKWHQKDTLTRFGWKSSVIGLPVEVHRGRGGDRTGYLYLGLMAERKGALGLVAAWQREFGRLKVAGEDVFVPSKEYVERVRAACGGGGVEWLGKVSHAGKVGLLCGTNALILPFLAPEAYSMVLLEANSYGTPVITTPEGGIAEMVVEGENGTFLRGGLREALKRAASISAGSCIEHARRHSPEAVAKRYLGLLVRW